MIASAAIQQQRLSTNTKTTEEIERDRKRRAAKLKRAQGIYEAESPAQALYLLVDEPESSIAARIISFYIIFAITISSFSFVLETLDYVKLDPSCNTVVDCSGVTNARSADACIASGNWGGCAWTNSSCTPLVAGRCHEKSRQSNTSACKAALGPDRQACVYTNATKGKVSRCSASNAVPCSGALLQTDITACNGLKVQDTEVCTYAVSSCAPVADCSVGWAVGTDPLITDPVQARCDGARYIAANGTVAGGAGTTGMGDDAVCVYKDTKSIVIWIELLCIGSFTVEYLLRLLTCWARPDIDDPDDPDAPPSTSTAKSIFSWATETMNLIDLLAIVPFYMELLLSNGGHSENPYAILRMFRMVRVFRVLKFGGHVKNLQLFVLGFRRAREGLMLLSFLLLLYLCVFGAMMHMLEYDEQRAQDRDGFESIPISWYFIMATMTTVGYGDHYPVTILGKICAGVCMICGIFVLGLPIVTVGATFDAVFKEEEREQRRAKEMIEQEEAEVAEASQDDWDASTENPLAAGSQTKPKPADDVDASKDFDKRVALMSMAQLMEGLFMKTGNERFDHAYHKLMAEDPDDEFDAG